MAASGEGAPAQTPTFVIGLALAGTISAGAYTAGVLDFLIEALEAWESERREGRQVPAHRVAISAISGTSAGGICAPLLAAALAHNDAPLRQDGRTKAFLPRLYDAWVTETKLFADRQQDISFTSTEDVDTPVSANIDYKKRALRKQRRIKSLLNGALLDRIATKALAVASNPPPRTAPRPYISKCLHLFLMTGNLRGVPYGIKFAQQQKHGMLLHADRIHATVANLGNHAISSPWADRETAGIALDAHKLGTPGPGSGAALDEQWERARIAALATCAFPAGLPSRIVTETGASKGDLVWPISFGYQPVSRPPYPNFVPDWPNATVPGVYSYVSADGGIANNEPFEYARWSIMSNPPDRNEREEIAADRAVIMIDPFPEPPEFDLGPDDDSMVATLQRLIGTLIDQGRFKFVELAEAQSEDTASRYLIAPSRPAANTDAASNGSSHSGINAIATGLTGGFGGFIAQSLRDHDYQLGRRNCQYFLREHFAVPEDNKKMFPDGPLANAVATTTPGSRQNIRYFPIIPLVGSAKVEVPQPEWPRLGQKVVEQVMAAAERRLNHIVPILLKEEVGGLFAGIAASLVWPIVRGGVLDRIRAAVMSDVVRRDQFDATRSLSDTDRRLLGLMYGDFSTQLTCFGLARRWAERISSKGGGPLSPEQISASLTGDLAKFVTNVGKRRTRNLNGEVAEIDAYQVTEFAPGFWKRLREMVDPSPAD